MGILTMFGVCAIGGVLTCSEPDTKKKDMTQIVEEDSLKYTVTKDVNGAIYDFYEGKRSSYALDTLAKEGIKDIKNELNANLSCEQIYEGIISIYLKNVKNKKRIIVTEHEKRKYRVINEDLLKKYSSKEWAQKINALYDSTGKGPLTKKNFRSQDEKSMKSKLYVQNQITSYKPQFQRKILRRG